MAPARPQDISVLVGRLCNLIKQWRHGQSISTLNEAQHIQLNELLGQILFSLLYQNQQSIQEQSRDAAMTAASCELKRESKFSNKLTYELPMDERQCRREHTLVKDLIREHNKWMMKNQIKHRVREVQDQLQRIKICHANRRRQRVHRTNKRLKQGEEDIEMPNHLKRSDQKDDSQDEFLMIRDEEGDVSEGQEVSHQQSEVLQLREHRAMEIAEILRALDQIQAQNNHQQSHLQPQKFHRVPEIFDSMSDKTFKDELTVDQNRFREERRGQIVTKNASRDGQTQSTGNSPESSNVLFTDYLNVNFAAQAIDGR